MFAKRHILGPGAGLQMYTDDIVVYVAGRNIALVSAQLSNYFKPIAI